MATLQEQILELQKKFQGTEQVQIAEIYPIQNRITYKQRFYWITGFFILTMFGFLITYNIQSEWFSVSSGLTSVATGLLLALMFDYKITNGDSFDKISENGNSLALTFIGFVLLFIGGLQWGEKYSPDRINGEALQRIEKQIGDLQIRLNSDTLTKPIGKSWDEGNTR